MNHRFSDDPFILILGMHRSGTSCLAGALEQCGLFLGDVRRSGTHNAKGYFEPAALVRLHDQLLAMNGGSWHRVPGQVKIHPALRTQIQDMADTLSMHRPCGLKDPRLLMIDEWATIPQAPVRYVGTFRHPAAVAASLNRRNGMATDAALALWLDYNKRLVERHQRAPFPLVAYDLSQPGIYRRAIATAATDLGLRVRPWRLWRFVARRLDHHGRDAAAAPVPSSCADIYRYLTTHSVQAHEAP